MVGGSKGSNRKSLETERKRNSTNADNSNLAQISSADQPTQIVKRSSFTEEKKQDGERTSFWKVMKVTYI